MEVFEKILEGLVIFFHSFPGGSPFCRFQTKFTENCLQSGEVPQIAKIPQTVVKIYMELPRLESTRTLFSWRIDVQKSDFF